MVPAQLPKFSGCFLKEKDISTIKDEVGQCISVLKSFNISNRDTWIWVFTMGSIFTIYSANWEDVG